MLKSTKPRVLFCVPDLQAGGAGNALLRLLRGMHEDRFETSLFIEVRRGELLEQLPSGVPVRFGVKHERHFPLLRYVCLLIATIRAARKADVLVSWVEGRTSFIAWLAGFLLGKPVVCWIHTDWTVFRHHTSRRAKAAMFVLRYMRRLVAVSTGVAAAVHEVFRVPRDRISVVYNGQNLDEIAAMAAEPLSPKDAPLVGPRTIVSIGRLVPVKGYDLLLEAMAQVVQREPGARLMLIGDGFAADQLREQAHRLQLDQHVSFAGHRTNPFSLLSRCGVFVSSSRVEGLPLAILEAMACGLPVAAFDCPSGTKEILRDGEFGLLIPLGNVTELADALVKLLQNEQLAAHYREQSLKRGKDFSLEQFVAGAEDVFEAVIAPEISGSQAAAYGR